MSHADRRDRTEREEMEAEAGAEDREARSGSVPESAPGVPAEEAAPAASTEPGRGEDVAGGGRDSPVTALGKGLEEDRPDRVPGPDEHGPIPGDGNRYVAVRLDEHGLEPDPGAFYDHDHEPRLGAMLDHVIDTEGPVHENVLVQRIARHHGFRRSGKRIRDIPIGLARGRRRRTREATGDFFRPGARGDAPAPARYRGRGHELRKFEHVCAEEIRAIDEALPSGGDAVEIARALGVARLGRSARTRMEDALSAARRD